MDDADLLATAREALAGLALPDGTPLLEAGTVSGPVVSGGRISLAISITAEDAASFADIRSRAETALRAMPGGDGAIVVLTAEKQSAAKQSAAAPPDLGTGKAPVTKPPVLSGVRHVVAVASGKGGVGKSTTSVNLALGLRSLGLKVGILDADIHGPSLPTLLALHRRPRLGKDRRLRPMQAFGLQAMSMGLMVDQETAMVWRGPMVMSAITQMLSDVDWGTLDVLIIDMPPGTGDAQLAIAQGTDLAGAVIVSTPQDLALIDARRGIAMFRKVDVPILGVIENMAHFICPDCGGRHALFGEGGAQAEARRLGAPYLGAVPLTMELRRASDSGQPIVALDPDGPLGQLYAGMARTLWSALEAAPHTDQKTLKGV
ncbi:MAG: Mrp/NBP35 family ATP-binding protein [Roseicyclus sp.]|nr:Mrp/NBP35 family ATP-binding protein [Roseicyclus sp.]MBO6624733.1 Mrp/NBP35 family ATP-binding protein [Roseicyclus sp.]MBO6923411.1 Mrp/NBP35 family ATP-binding protein [Roseicyclus sp.]